MTVSLLKSPTEDDWWEVKRRALITIGKKPVNPPDSKWKHEILKARHSPIRYLQFCFLLEDIPYWVSVHLCRHIHAQPYVSSQRKDWESNYNRDEEPQGALVTMILDMNAEELMIMANKRLCNKASKKTQSVVQRMCLAALDSYPEFAGLLVPMCEYHGGKCKEMYSCSEKVWREGD